jgi:DNA helicase-2/ATP-dependent DNA helicase PcrA
MARDYVLQPFRPEINLQIDYAGALNAQQHAAVTAPPGPALVIAGAGAGKTRTLIYRVAFLLEQGISAERILLLTFTNKAAREMMRRVADLLGNQPADLWGGTFHAIGHRILRRHADRLGYQRDFTILDREDASDLVGACLADAQVDLQATRFPKADVLANIFSLAVNMEHSIPQVLADQYPYFNPLAVEIAGLQLRYRARKQSANVMDFDDLLVLWLKLLQEHDELREQYQRRFQFILVDEYQDTNKLQSDLIDLLAARHQNVMVVGDDSQSIYSWRGANFRNILEFPKRYPEAKIYKIEVNYRSTPEILTVANAAIAPNLKQFFKLLTPERKTGAKPIVVVCQDAQEQARFLGQRVLELRDEGAALNKMAVLYRSHFHALELQLELTRRNIPFSITSGIRFFEQAHVKDAVAYLKFVCNPRGELPFKRIIRLMPGVGGKSAEKLWAKFSSVFRVPAAGPGDMDRRDDPGPGVAANGARAPGAQTPPPAREERRPRPDESDRRLGAGRNNPLATALQACVESVPKKTAVAWAQLVATISQLEDEAIRAQPAQMLRLVLEAGYQDHLKETYANASARLEDLDQLASFARQFSTTDDFLGQLALLTNLEAEEDRPAAADDERLRLSTIHQAKGLEFDVVFIIMLCDGLFPSARSLKHPENEEEERRLFYVAITRARNELYLSYPLLRLGDRADALQQASRFLKEIPAGLVEELHLRPFNPYG